MCLVTSTLQMEAVFFSKTFPTTHKSRLCHCVEDHVLSCEILKFYENKLALVYLTVDLKDGCHIRYVPTGSEFKKLSSYTETA